MIVLQLMLFCALFTLMVKIAVGNNALNGLYFYPKPVQERAFEIGLADRETVARKRKRSMEQGEYLPSCVSAGPVVPGNHELVRRHRD